MSVYRSQVFARVWRLSVVGLFALVVIGAGGQTAAVAQSASEFTTAAKQAILLDSRSGKVFFEKNADQPMAPASMSKVMTMLMVFEGLKRGRLRLDDEFLISEDAWRRGGASSGGSTMYAELNSNIKLRDLMRGVVIQSGNDASIALAEGISGSEEAFAAAMTKRVRELGLRNTTFKNATGLPHDEHLSTARDLASLTRYLIEVFPEYYKLYSEREFTWNDITQQNRNPLLSSFPGADGVKTGFIRAAGYGLIGSAVRNGRRLVIVLNGMRSKAERAREAKKLLSWGFRQFRTVNVFRKGETVGDARVWGGVSATVGLIAHDDVRMMLSANEQSRAEAAIVYNGPLMAPVKKGMKVGTLRLMIDGRSVSQQDVFAAQSVAVSDSMWRKAFDTVMVRLFGG